MEEHNGTHMARNHEQVENHSLASMSTIAIIVIHKTKNVSQLLGKKRPSLGMYLVESVSCLLQALTPKKSFVKTKNVKLLLGKKGPLLGMYKVKTVSCLLEAPPPPPKKELEGPVRVLVPRIITIMTREII